MKKEGYGNEADNSRGQTVNGHVKRGNGRLSGCTNGDIAAKGKAEKRSEMIELFD